MAHIHLKVESINRRVVVDPRTTTSMLPIISMTRKEQRKKEAKSTAPIYVVVRYFCYLRRWLKILVVAPTTNVICVAQSINCALCGAQHHGSTVSKGSLSLPDSMI